MKGGFYMIDNNL